jgi:hypothetical protein
MNSKFDDKYSKNFFPCGNVDIQSIQRTGILLCRSMREVYFRRFTINGSRSYGLPKPLLGALRVSSVGLCSAGSLYLIEAGRPIALPRKKGGFN